MSKEEYSTIINEIENLPQGGISYKKINGKEYAYYQWRENGKQRSRRVKDDELELLTNQISRRKELQNILKNNNIAVKITPQSTYNFHCAIRIGDELDRFVKPVKDWKKRQCYHQLYDYVYSDIQDKVFILYGLRRTGKTTIIRQLISDMDREMRNRTVFIQMQDKKTLADINQDLKYLESKGYKYLLMK